MCSLLERKRKYLKGESLAFGVQAEKKPMVWYLAGSGDLIVFREGRRQLPGQFGVGMEKLSQLPWGLVIRRHGVGWWETGGPISSPYHHTDILRPSLGREEARWLPSIAISSKPKHPMLNICGIKLLLYSLSFWKCYRMLYSVTKSTGTTLSSFCRYKK